MFSLQTVEYVKNILTINLVLFHNLAGFRAPSIVKTLQGKKLLFLAMQPMQHL